MSLHPCAVVLLPTDIWCVDVHARITIDELVLRIAWRLVTCLILICVLTIISLLLDVRVTHVLKEFALLLLNLLSSHALHPSKLVAILLLFLFLEIDVLITEPLQHLIDHPFLLLLAVT